MTEQNDDAIRVHNKRGPKVGQRHSGQFTSDDPRRCITPIEAAKRRDIRLLAQEFSPELVTALITIVRDKNEHVKYRLNAIGRLLDRGHGKPTQSAELTVTTSSDVKTLTDAELIALIVAEQPALEHQA